MTRFISVISGKGGVGKTTLVSNLSAALAELGQDVIAIDVNPTTANLGVHLGLHLSPNTLHGVLRGDIDLSSAIYPHPLGFKVVPSSMNINDLVNVDIGKLPEVTLSLRGKADYVLLDSAAGLGREAMSAMTAAEEILLITNPELPSVLDALKTAKLAETTGKKIIGVVVNRIKDKWYELGRWEIEKTLDLPILAEIPEDKNVSKSLLLKMPVMQFAPDSPASLEIKRLAHSLVGKEFTPRKRRRFRILDRLVEWMVG